MDNNMIADWHQIKLLTVPEVADWARVHPKTVHRWIHNGKLKAVCFGNRTYRIPEAEIERLLREMGWFNVPTSRSTYNR